MKKIIRLSVAIAALMLSFACQKKEQYGKVTLDVHETTIEKGGDTYVFMTDGNGEYRTTFSIEGIADIVTLRHGTIRIKGVAAGETTLTVTDRMNTSDTLHITVIEPTTAE